MSELSSVVISQTSGGKWKALHTPSGKETEGSTPQEAHDTMRLLLGIGVDGDFAEPKTSERFSGIAKDIALYLEGPVSDMLALHSGFARLESYAENDGEAHVRLGGGCQGCPSSTITLLNGVKAQLQEQFGESQVVDVIPHME